jgi:hypothetical protein
MILTNDELYSVFTSQRLNHLIKSEELCEKYSDQLAKNCLENFKKYSDSCLVLDITGDIACWSLSDIASNNPLEGVPIYIIDYAQALKRHKEEKEKKEIIIVFVYLEDNFLPSVVCMVKPEIHTISKRKIEKDKNTEFDLEQNLVQWIKSHGINCETQVLLKHGRLDIWIPNVCVIELKKNTITSKDVCQVINYYAETKRKILLVGKSASQDVVKTIENFNYLIGADVLAFVSLSTIKIYLKGLLGIN